VGRILNCTVAERVLVQFRRHSAMKLKFTVIQNARPCGSVDDRCQRVSQKIPPQTLRRGGSCGSRKGGGAANAQNVNIRCDFFARNYILLTKGSVLDP
jgi:hypothetical protein